MRGIFGWKVYVVTSGKPDQGIIMHGERANLVVACPSRASLVKEHAGMGGDHSGVLHVFETIGTAHERAGTPGHEW